MDNQYNLARELDSLAQKRRGIQEEDRVTTILDDPNETSQDAEDYDRQRAEIVAREVSLAWDFVCKQKALAPEVKANEILQRMREHDDREIYGKAPKPKGYLGQEHRRFMGDHFLYNVDLIEKTLLYKAAQRMPKGAHLHIHFNANLLPHVLIDVAGEVPRMHIRSDVALVPASNDPSSPSYYANFDRARIKFMVLSKEKERTEGTGNLFDRKYIPEKHMVYEDFRKEFGRRYTKCTVDQWLISKLVFDEREAHGLLQTAEGAWNRFNARTQMMKGLFNYERAYRIYTQKCLEAFVEDGIQYAEIRVNFMNNNQLLDDDGEMLTRNGQKGNELTLNVIIEECEAFVKRREEEGLPPCFHGMKVIYCVPRSFDPSDVRKLLRECLNFKKNKDYKNWIAGVDLVGEEGAPNSSLNRLKAELLQFRKDVKHAKIEIPFLFHCGETLDIGDGTPDGNLYDALLLGAKRIGHGYALPRHPLVLEYMKKANVCVELCPISNEILGLTPRVNGHAMYNLLANNVHCTVNTDNGTLFKSKLSHDFYQVFAGKTDMTLFGWKQLALWSIDHACMESEDKRTELRNLWLRLWDDYCVWLGEKYGYLLEK